MTGVLRFAAAVGGGGAEEDAGGELPETAVGGEDMESLSVGGGGV
ncbi:hypothetical protein [Streptomyces ochraceiscleroticus]|uniref:Uncharacterized protein n=1 Tax=Streptomyces ochraceiscleroticus TaxID=47761 RepID=A0ABW1MKF8_9ACTN|nr:hypothetical protein [Streptomyces ochraceiscleroticus]